MSRIAYVNGRYVRHADAAVHIEDRGYQFADGVYEVCEIWRGRIVDQRRHLDRLERSLRELSIRVPLTRSALQVVLREVVRRNRVADGLVYIQVTRGAARRDHFFPAPETPPTLVVTARSTSRAAADRIAAEGFAVVTLPDNRWERVDIKTTGLLPNVMAKEKARAAEAQEAWFVDRDGYVTEGASTTAWIVIQDGTLVTRPNGAGLLPGITRVTATETAQRAGLTVAERKFTPEEAKKAREAFVTAATTIVMPVVRIDGVPIGSGRPGPVAERLRAAFHDVAETAP